MAALGFAVLAPLLWAQEARGLQNHVGSSSAAEAWAGNMAPLTEEGYQAVAALNSDAAMKTFITRKIQADGRSVTSGKELDLDGLTMWYSGSKAKQSMAALTEELSKVPWVEAAATASRAHSSKRFSWRNKGAQKAKRSRGASMLQRMTATVNATATAAAMGALKPHGLVAAVGRLKNWASSLAGHVTAAVAVTETTVNESSVTSVSNAKNSTSAKTKAQAKAAEAKAVKANDPVSLAEEAAKEKAAMTKASHMAISATGYQYFVQSNSKAAARQYLQRVAAFEGLRVIDNHTFDEMVRYYDGDCGWGTYESFVAELHDGAERGLCAEPWTERLPEKTGKATILDRWSGLAERLPTWRFMMRAAKEQNQKAKAEASGHVLPDTLATFVGHVSKVLSGGRLGETASLDEAGYAAVAQAESEEDMTSFIHRAAWKMGLKISNMPTFQAMVAFYDGECDMQSYEVLVQELKRGHSRSNACGGPWLTAQ